jgi:uncharacterized membrane protein YecN with MAPEG domain
MALVHLVIGLALIEFFLFALAVARARTTYHVPAPATAGNEVFERYFRVQMNTLEQLMVFIPGMLLFGHYVSAWLAAALGLMFILGRALYFFGYVKSAPGRHRGFLLSVIPNAVLLIGGVLGALRAVLILGFAA